MAVGGGVGSGVAVRGIGVDVADGLGVGDRVDGVIVGVGVSGSGVGVAVGAA